VDITKLRSQRRAVINPIHSDDAASIQVIKIGKKTRLGVKRANDGGQRSKSRKRSLSKGGRENVDDLEAEVETDEDKLLLSLQKKRHEKARFVEGVRDKQQRLFELNEKIRQYDISTVKDEELDALSKQIAEID
jgi:hypothetical protein